MACASPARGTRLPQEGPGFSNSPQGVGSTIYPDGVILEAVCVQ